MNFLSPDLCKELQSAGIVNESGFVYRLSDTLEEGWKHVYEIKFIGEGRVREDDIPAYITEIAFLVPSEIARANSAVWTGSPEMAVNFRAELNTLSLGESIEDFLRRTRAK